MRQTRQRRRCGALTEHHTGFLIWEFPTVYISQKLRVAKYLGEDRYSCIYPVLTWSWTILGANIVLWGVVLMLHAAGTSFGAIFALRILLGTATSIRYHEAPALTMTGMLESCVAPILILIISMFYKKNEQATRISWFYVMVRAPVLCIRSASLIRIQNGLTQIFGGFVAYVSRWRTTAGHMLSLLSGHLL